MTQPFSLHSLSVIPSDAFVEILKERNIAQPLESVITIVITDSYLDTRLAAFNDKSLESGQPLILVKPTGLHWCVGPIIVPQDTGCWVCLMKRLSGVGIAERIAQFTSSPRPRLKRLSGTHNTDQAFQFAAKEIALWVEGKAQTLGRIALFNSNSQQLTQHTVQRRPQCPACGSIESNWPSPPVLEDTVSLSGNKLRYLSPEDTYHKCMDMYDPITGLINDVCNLMPDQNEDVFMYGVTCSLPLIRPPQSSNMAFNVSFGTGTSELQARVSALCEGIERYSCVYQGYEFSVDSAYTDLEGAIHPHSLLLFDPNQYQNREQLNTSDAVHLDWIPEPFDEFIPISWIPAWSLSEECFKYVPAAYCYDHYFGPGRRFCEYDSNGHATGSSLMEAILHGILELIERDSVGLWWYNQVQVPAYDLNSITHDAIRQIMHFVASLNRSLTILDITSDLGIPVFVAISTEESEHILLGFGAHFNPEQAILRALNELCQKLSVVLPLRRGIKAEDDLLTPHQIAWWHEATLENQPYLNPLPHSTTLNSSIYSDNTRNTLLDYINLCIQATSCAGIELLVLDQSRPDAPLHATKVIAPGLRHLKRRLGPGRMYDVPPKIDWLANANQMCDLNPLSIMF